MIDLVIHRPEYESGFIPLIAGEQKCPPSHEWGPKIRDYYLIHFCLGGKGVFENESGVYPVKAQEIFVIKKGELARYKADQSDPWKYVWIGFVGDMAKRFDELPPVMSVPMDIPRRLHEFVEAGESASEIYISLLYELIYRLMPHSSKGQSKLSEIYSYINYRYTEGITVADVSRHFGFDRSYLYRIFKEKYGMGIKEYLTTVRMEHARMHLIAGYSVSQVAQMVGFMDEFNFSKAFKKHFGIAPSKIRKTDLYEQNTADL